MFFCRSAHNCIVYTARHFSQWIKQCSTGCCMSVGSRIPLGVSRFLYFVFHSLLYSLTISASLCKLLFFVCSFLLASTHRRRKGATTPTPRNHVTCLGLLYWGAELRNNWCLTWRWEALSKWWNNTAPEISRTKAQLITTEYEEELSFSSRKSNFEGSAQVSQEKWL